MPKDDHVPAPALEASTPEPGMVRLALVAILATLFFATLGQTIVSTALPVMVADLGGMLHMTWVVTAYLLASAISAPVSGKLGDLYGRKVVLQTGIIVFIVGAVLCGLAQTMWMVILGRAIQGAGAGGLIVTSMAVAADFLPARDRGKAQGLLSAAFGVSTVIGPLVGGFIVENFSWHWVFFVNLPVGILAFIIYGFALPRRPERPKPTIDYAGAALLTAILAAAVLVTNMGGSAFGWGSPEIVALLAIGFAALAAFVWTERHASEPILPMSLFRNNAFLVVNFVGMLVGTAMFSTVTFTPLFLQVVKGVSPTGSGLFLIPMTVGMLGGSLAAGRIMSRTGHYKHLPVLSAGLLALTMFSLTTLNQSSPLWHVAAALFGVGLGMGPVLSIGVAAIQNAVPPSMLGVGTASTNMFRLIGGSVGTSGFGALYNAGLTRNLAGQLPQDVSGRLQFIGADMVQSLPPETQAVVLDGISRALHPIFWLAGGFAMIACLASTQLREQPLSGVDCH